MSPSSVHDDGIKGVDTDALSHLGLNVGKPIELAESQLAGGNPLSRPEQLSKGGVRSL